MYNFFENLEKGLKKSIDSEPDKTNARKKYSHAVAGLGKKLYTENEKIAWCGALAPFDILNAMNITTCFVEFIGAMLTSTGLGESFMKEAEDHGYPMDSCGFHRAVTGAMLKNVMPEPDFLVATTSPCVASLTVLENMARHYKKELFVLNIPQQKTKAGIDFLADQLEELTGFISLKTGKKISQDDFEISFAHTNRSRELMIEIYDLAASKPSPLNSKMMKDFGLVMGLFLGTEEGVKICEAFRDELKEKVENNIPGIKNERIRLLWLHSRFQFKNNIEKQLAENFGANIISDELNSVSWKPLDPEKPYHSIAKRMLSIPFVQDSETMVNHLKNMAEKYQVDGVINPAHWGCRQATGATGMISSGLKEIGVPVLNLDTDCVDTRNFAEGQIKTRMEAFMEMLSNSKSPWV